VKARNILDIKEEILEEDLADVTPSIRKEKIARIA
jgi:hypothetical protein